MLRRSDARAQVISRRHLLRLAAASAASALPLIQVVGVAAQTAPPTPTRTPTPTPGPGTPTPPGSPTATPVPADPTPTAVPAPDPPTQTPWVQALRPIPLWSGPDDAAVEFGMAERWDYFQIVQPQQGPRLFVFVARNEDYAWVDALSVGPSGPPPEGWPPPDSARTELEPVVGWVATLGDVPLYADPEGSLVLGLAPPFTTLKQVAPQDGPLLVVQDPYSAGLSYVHASQVGLVGPPEKPGLPGRWWGVLAVDGANVRGTPSTRQAPVGQLTAGVPLIVSGWVEGEEVLPDNPTWAQLADGVFMHSSVLRPVALPAAPAPPIEAADERGRWIDLNLTYQVIAAYEGRTAVYVARTSTGRPGWLTATGRFPIQRRVEKETMESASLIGRDAQRADYKVENVRWTQYFTTDGVAVHENYWKPRDQFGIPSSHGCAGLVAEDAKFFWDWAAVGTPIYSHY